MGQETGYTYGTMLFLMNHTARGAGDRGQRTVSCLRPSFLPALLFFEKTFGKKMFEKTFLKKIKKVLAFWEMQQYNYDS